MKVVALEEPFATEQMLAAWRALRPDLQGIAVRQSTDSDVERRLFDLGPERIELMDKAGVQVQVLSLIRKPIYFSDDPRFTTPEERGTIAGEVKVIACCIYGKEPDAEGQDKTIQED